MLFRNAPCKRLQAICEKAIEVLEKGSQTTKTIQLELAILRL